MNLMASKSFLCNTRLTNSTNVPDSPHDGLKHNQTPVDLFIQQLAVCLLE